MTVTTGKKKSKRKQESKQMLPTPTVITMREEQFNELLEKINGLEIKVNLTYEKMLVLEVAGDTRQKSINEVRATLYGNGAKGLKSRVESLELRLGLVTGLMVGIVGGIITPLVLAVISYTIFKVIELIIQHPELPASFTHSFF